MPYFHKAVENFNLSNILSTVGNCVCIFELAGYWNKFTITHNDRRIETKDFPL